MVNHRFAAPLLAGWTVFLWGSRIRNVLVDEDLSTIGQAWRLGVAGLFIVLGVVTLWAWRRRDEPVRFARVLGVLVVWTIGFWIVRGGGILIDDHTAGFKAIHTVLMAISIGLAVWARPRRVATTAPLNTVV